MTIDETIEKTLWCDSCDGKEYHSSACVNSPAQIDRDRIDALAAELKEYREFVGASTVVEGKDWSIANNGNPAGLIALRQFDDDGNTLSYTHHDSAIDAWRELRNLD